MRPRGNTRPSEKGLVGVMEAQCATQDKAGAEATLKDYHQFFPGGTLTARVDLDWAKLQGATGDAQGAARSFQALIQASPAANEADEARLALATLLTDGKLQSKDAEAFPGRNPPGRPEEGRPEGGFEPPGAPRQGPDRAIWLCASSAQQQHIV